MVPAATPQTKPAATRVSVASAWVCNSPVRARSVKVVQITEGGGTRRPLESPIRTAISQNTASATGSRRSEEHTSELQSLRHLVCRLLLEKKKVANNAA